jgi:uncharacterized phage protein (TIGR01671 family)
MIMNRTIKFRGKDINTKKWVFGDLVHNKGISLTGLYDRVCVSGYEVISETVGQFIGQIDSEGKEIYEDDIVLFEIVGVGCGKERIIFVNGSFVIHNETMGNLPLIAIDGKVYKINKVLGNIHDNPELLTVK